MSDHEFEKQVQQKMEELKLRPSDTVWMEVEKKIREDKRRRRFFWLWIPLLFICLSTSGFILYRYVYAPNQTSIIAKATPSSKSNKLIAETTESKNIQQQPEQKNTETVIEQNTDNNNKPVTHSTAKPVTSWKDNESSSTAAIPKAPVQKAEAGISSIAMKKSIGFKKNNYKPAAHLPEQTQATIEQQNDASTAQDALDIAMPEMIKEEDRGIATDKITDSLSKKTFPLAVPNTVTSDNTAAIVPPIQRKKSTPWHWGVQTEAGVSRIAEYKLFQLKGLLGQEQYKAQDVSGNASASSGSTLFANGVTLTQNAAPIQPDFSFSAGLFVEFTVSKRFRLSTGLQYAYGSMHTEVGPKIVAPALVNQGTSSAKIVPEYYKIAGSYDPTVPAYVGAAAYRPQSVSQLYRYRFQFVELPVMMHWQINKGRRLPPIMLNGGLSISQLTSVDALHYEGTKGIYYKDDDLFNKTQLNFMTGISVGLMQRTKHPMWIGPDLRYALSGLVKKQVSGGQYIWSTGITVKFMLGRL